MSDLYLVALRAVNAPDLCKSVSLQCNLVATIIHTQIYAVRFTM